MNPTEILLTYRVNCRNIKHLRLNLLPIVEELIV